MRRIIFLAMLLALPAMAAEKDANYYKRTQTAPPGEFVIGPSFHYSMQFSPGVTFGYRWNNGVQLLGDASMLRLDAQDGEAALRVGCRTYMPAYTTGSHTTGQVGIQVLFPLKALARQAK